jgi:hypothetical protein
MSRRNFAHTVNDVFWTRRRAIRHVGGQFDSVLSLDNAGFHGRELERGATTLAFRVDGRSVILRVHAWEDRWLWVDARHSCKGGWQWQFSAQGRFLPAAGARAVVTKVEEMLRAAHLPAEGVTRALAAIWARCLAAGPDRVHQ